MSESTATGHTTALLLHRIRAGDAGARQLLVQRLDPLLWRFARGRVPQLLRHQQDTGDLVQQTWVRVLERIEGIQAGSPGDFFAYLRAVLVNALRESMRRQARAPLRPPGGHEDVAVDAALPAQSVDPGDWLLWEQSLALLEPAHRALVLMRFEFGMSFGEIAAELGESADGVRMKLNRAVARMALAAGAA